MHISIAITAANDHPHPSISYPRPPKAHVTILQTKMLKRPQSYELDSKILQHGYSQHVWKAYDLNDEQLNTLETITCYDWTSDIMYHPYKGESYLELIAY